MTEVENPKTRSQSCTLPSEHTEPQIRDPWCCRLFSPHPNVLFLIRRLRRSCGRGLVIRGRHELSKGHVHGNLDDSEEEGGDW